MHEINLGEDIDVRHAEVDHGGQREQQHGYEFGRVTAVVRVNQVNGGDLSGRAENDEESDERSSQT